MAETDDLGLGRDGAGEEVGPGRQRRLARFVMDARMPGRSAGTTGDEGEQGQGGDNAEAQTRLQRRGDNRVWVSHGERPIGRTGAVRGGSG